MAGAKRLPAYRPAQLPAEDCWDGHTFTLDGIYTRNVTFTGGPSVLVISAEGGTVYYAINGTLATVSSPGCVPDGGNQKLGPIANLNSLSLFGAANTKAHITLCRAHGVEAGVTWETYPERVLATGPIAYWPLSETSGTTAVCQVNPLQNGTYTGVTLASAASPTGSPCPLFDGANDSVAIYTATFSGAFNGATGSMAVWCKVYDSGCWSDVTQRNALSITRNGNNNYSVRKSPIASRTTGYGEAGAASAQVWRSPFTSTDWFHLAATWSDDANDDEFKFYVNGTQYGGTSAGLGTWGAGALNTQYTAIGAYDRTTPAYVWYGWLAHAVVWDTVLSPATIAELATV